MSHPEPTPDTPIVGWAMPTWERDNRELSLRLWRLCIGAFYSRQIALEEALKRVESPIEAQFLAALLTDKMNYEEPIIVDSAYDFGPPAPVEWHMWKPVIVAPQHRILNFRVDFAIRHDGTGRRVVVECDGHEFHEKTKEQAARDKRRDRELMAVGWPVLRFTGSEIYRDAFGCARQVAAVLEEMTPEQQRDLDAFLREHDPTYPEYTGGADA